MKIKPAEHDFRIEGQWSHSEQFRPRYYSVKIKVILPSNARESST